MDSWRALSISNIIPQLAFTAMNQLQKRFQHKLKYWLEVFLGEFLKYNLKIEIKLHCILWGTYVPKNNIFCLLKVCKYKLNRVSFDYIFPTELTSRKMKKNIKLKSRKSWNSFVKKKPVVNMSKVMNTSRILIMHLLKFSLE